MSIPLLFNTYISPKGKSNSNSEIPDLKLNAINYSDITIISDDDCNGKYWNNGDSIDPSIATDENGGVHVVWSDNTDGPWGTDSEIFYASFTPGIGWSNATCISDGYKGKYWNNGYSGSPSIAVDKDGGVHVVWYDYSVGPWTGGLGDAEIFYASFTPGIGWSNATCISDGYNGTYWNNGYSTCPRIAVDNVGGIHVVWEDDTVGPWTGGAHDSEIFYVSFTPGIGWSNVTVISDGYKGKYWNYGDSFTPSIAIDENGGIHVVWSDNTNGPWGTDSEIMYASFTPGVGWSNATCISDGYKGIYWNNGDSLEPRIAIDNKNNIHVVWSDYTNGP
ncbi:MAG: hypothetical protein P8Y70_18235 [Candidatus Lokiarchaeota archaeon]